MLVEAGNWNLQKHRCESVESRMNRSLVRTVLKEVGSFAINTAKDVILTARECSSSYYWAQIKSSHSNWTFRV